MRRCGCDDQQKQCNRNYTAMDDIYVTITMQNKLCDDRQRLCDKIDAKINFLSHAEHFWAFSEKTNRLLWCSSTVLNT